MIIKRYFSAFKRLFNFKQDSLIPEFLFILIILIQLFNLSLNLYHNLHSSQALWLTILSTCDYACYPILSLGLYQMSRMLIDQKILLIPDLKFNNYNFIFATVALVINLILDWLQNGYVNLFIVFGYVVLIVLMIVISKLLIQIRKKQQAELFDIQLHQNN